MEMFVKEGSCSAFCKSDVRKGGYCVIGFGNARERHTLICKTLQKPYQDRNFTMIIQKLSNN
jgi:hypothetical protein